MERIKVTIYTDPGCPFGFNAQRQETQLLWHYGEALVILRKMIVLTEKSSTFEELGLSREMIAGNAKRLRSSYGMPMLTEPPDRLAATIHACQVYVGARLNGPARADLLLRALRRRAFSQGQPLDELDTIHAAGVDAGIAPDTLDAWLADERVESAARGHGRDQGTAARGARSRPSALARQRRTAIFDCLGGVRARRPARGDARLPTVRGVRGGGRQRRAGNRAPAAGRDGPGDPVLVAVSARHGGGCRASGRGHRSSARRTATGGRDARRCGGRRLLDCSLTPRDARSPWCRCGRRVHRVGLSQATVCG